MGQSKSLDQIDVLNLKKKFRFKEIQSEKKINKNAKQRKSLKKMCLNINKEIEYIDNFDNSKKDEKNSIMYSNIRSGIQEKLVTRDSEFINDD